MPLSPSHVDLLTAVIDRVIPKDDWPAASEAGVLDFLLPLLESEALVETYAANLSKLPSDFLALSGEAQDLAMRTSFSSTFLELVARQTIEGYYANPKNGGNKEEVAWRMIGFEVTA